MTSFAITGAALALIVTPVALATLIRAVASQPVPRPVTVRARRRRG